MAENKSGPGILDREQLQRAYQASRSSYEEALSTLDSEVRTLLESHGYTPTTKYRIKRFNNYFGKLKKVLAGTKGSTEGQITDLLGLRIICPFLEDLEVIEALLGEHFTVVEAERKGAQNSFREFGYDSVHMLIEVPGSGLKPPIPFSAPVCEIQLRTILQDAWAEVEHELVYKSDIDLPNESVKRKLAALNANLTLSDLIFQELRDYQKEVRSRGQKRRESIEDCLLAHSLISISHQPERNLPLAGPVVPKGLFSATDLEKTMLAALNAHSRNELEVAIELYGQLLEAGLESRIRALVYNHRGMAYFSLEKYPRAFSDFSASIRHDGNSYRSWTNRGLVNRVMGKFAAAVEDYSRALEIDPASPGGFFGRAQAFCEMRLFTKALADCEQAMKLQPEHVPARQLAELIRREMLSGKH